MGKGGGRGRGGGEGERGRVRGRGRGEGGGGRGKEKKEKRWCSMGKTTTNLVHVSSIYTLRMTINLEKNLASRDCTHVQCTYVYYH